jgi:hypothetical protein
MAINDGTSDVSEWQVEGEQTGNEVCHGTMAYRSGLGVSTTVRTRYRADTATTHDAVATKIFGLRLDAFEDHFGVQATDTITHSVLNTFQEYAGDGALTATRTGIWFAMGLPLHVTNERFKHPQGRIQLDGVDFGTHTHAVVDNGSASQIGPIDVHVASVTSGTRDWDFDVREVNDIAPTYDCDEQIAAAFSAELAAAVDKIPQSRRVRQVPTPAGRGSFA